jgi:DNA ligase-associated metallophosphoesterase
MTAAPIHIAGERLMLDPAGALLWPEHGLMAVSDLHLEKGTAFASRGMLLPPWDTRVTLDRLTLLLRRHRPRIVVALGDSFHDRAGAARLPNAEIARITAMTGATRFIWVLGNHDPEPAAQLGGDWVDEFPLGALIFRHQGEPTVCQTQQAGEICGHHHPKAAIAVRGGSQSRACFVTDARRVMLPAFGAYTGGLDVTHPEIARLFPRGGRVFLLGRERLFSFAMGMPPRGLKR